MTVTFTEVECISDNDGDGAELHWTTTIRPASGAAIFNMAGRKTLNSGGRYTLSSTWQKTFEMDNSSKFWVEGWMEEEDDWFRGDDDDMGSDSHEWAFNVQTYRWESFSDITRFLNFPNDGQAKIHYSAVTADSTLLVETVSPNIYRLVVSTTGAISVDSSGLLAYGDVAPSGPHTSRPYQDVSAGLLTRSGRSILRTRISRKTVRSLFNSGINRAHHRLQHNR